MTQPTLHEQLDRQKLKIFAARDSLPEALEFVQSAAGDTPRAVWMTAIYVYHNTLLNELQKTLVLPEAEPVKGIPVDSDLFNAIEYVFNALPNKRMAMPGFKDTYAIASALGRVKQGQPV